MPTYNLQVSCHGQVQQGGRFPVAKEWQFKFFVKMGETLGYPESEEIYKKLADNDLAAVNKKVVNIYFEGKEIDNYALWDLNDSNYVSGVLLAGSTKPVVDISGTTQQKPIYLANLLTLAVEALGINVGTDEVNVYFNACR